MSDIPAAPKPKRRRWLLILAALVGVCLILTVLIALLSPPSEEESTATSTSTTVAALPEPSATALPEPSATALPEPSATALPEPSATATAAAIIPTDTPLPPTAPPPTEAPANITIAGVTDYTDSIDARHIVGEVLNDSAGSLTYVQIIATAYDAGGSTLDTTFTFTIVDILLPGARAPFDVTFINPPANFDHYELQLQYEDTADQPITVDILSRNSSTDTIGAMHIAGEVQNPHDFPLEYVQIIGTCYDTAGAVLRVGFTFTTLDVLQPAGRSPFELVFIDPPAAVDHCDLQTQAERQ